MRFALLLILVLAVFGLEEADASSNKGSRSRLVSKLKREVATAKGVHAAAFNRNALELKKGDEEQDEEWDEEEDEDEPRTLTEGEEEDEEWDEEEVRALFESEEDEEDEAFDEELEKEWVEEEEEEEEEENENEDDRRAKAEEEEE